MYAFASIELEGYPAVVLAPAIARGASGSWRGMTASFDPGDHSALIVAIATRRDRAAFAVLFAHFAPRIKAYLQRAGAGGAAEEMAQETMLAVWNKAHQFDPARAAAATWIFAIARNLRIDAARRARLALPEPDPTDVAQSPLAADSVLDAEQRSRRLSAALETLSAEQAEVVRLAYFDDRPHSEIEAALGIPLGTVKSRLRLAMQKLRGMLDNDL